MIADRVNNPTRRRGFGLVEMAVSGALFAAMVVIAAQLVGWVALDRKATGRRERATRLVANVMERVLAHPWTEIATEPLAPLARSATEGKPTAFGSLSIEVAPSPAIDGRGVKKITVEVRRPDRSQVAESPVRLIAWTFEPKGNRP